MPPSEHESLEHEAIEALLGAYALDAVDGDEQDQVEAHLATCPRCRAEVADHREVAALLGHGGASAPAGIWDRIRDALEEPPPRMRLAIEPKDGDAHPADTASIQTGPSAPVVSLADRRRRVTRRVALAAAVAVAAVVIAVLGVEVANLSHRLDHMRDSSSLALAAGHALADPSSRQATLKTVAGATAARAVVTATGEGYVLAEGLPALDGKIYQLWGEADGTVVSLGVMGSHPSVVGFSADGDVGQILITVEDAPVQQTRNTPLLSGTLA